MRKSIRKMPIIKMFMPKRRKNGALWASLAGLGISAAVFGATKGKQKNFTLPFAGNMKNIAPKLNLKGANNAVKNMVPKVNINSMDNTALAEFSEELLQSALNKK